MINSTSFLLVLGLIVYLMVGCIFIFSSDFIEIFSFFKEFDHVNKDFKFPINIFLWMILGLVFIILFVLIFGLYPIAFLLRYLGGNDRYERQHKKKERIFKNKIKGIDEPINQSIIVPKGTVYPEPSQIYYIQITDNPIVDTFFITKYDLVNSILNHYKKDWQKEFKLVYYPKILSEWELSPQKLIDSAKYINPVLDEDEIKKNIQSKYFSNQFNPSHAILSLLGFEGELYNGFLRATNDDSEYYTTILFNYVKINPKTEDELERLLWYYSYYLKERPAEMHFMKVQEEHLRGRGDMDNIADFKFNYDAHRISEEIRSKIEELKNSGFYHLIYNVLSNELTRQPTASESDIIETTFTGQYISSLLITTDYKILLPNYNNLEVKMSPLPKALYFLFIRHPEGIIFKYIYEYRDELLEIYKNLMYFNGWEDAVESINQLTDPTGNSINEKCSRIKEAFISVCDDNIAKYYYITGRRGFRKGILLNPDLIIIENDIINADSKKIIYTKSLSEEEIEERVNIIEEKYKIAVELMNNKEYLNAIYTFDEIITLNRYHYNSYSRRAVCHFEIGNYIDSELDINTAIKLNSEASLEYHNRGEVRIMLKRYEEALEDFTYYIENHNNTSNESYYFRGLAKMNLNLIESAIQDWCIAKELGNEDAKKYLDKYKDVPFEKVKIPTLK